MMFFSRWISIFVLSLILSLGIPQTTFAQTDGSTCLNQFGEFVTSLLSIDNAEEYWKDILERNACQQGDIFALDDEIEALMKRLREEYYDHCSSERIQTFQREIQEKKMEIDFIRKLIPFVESTLYANEVETLEKELPNMILALKQELKKRYVDDKRWVNETQFNALFSEWTERYSHRIDDYLSCPDSAWKEVSERWTKFQEGLKEIVNAFKNINKNADEEAALAEQEESDREAEQANSLVGEKASPFSSIKGFIQKHVGFRINHLEPRKGLEEIIEEAEKEGDLITAQEAFLQFQVEEERHDDLVSGADLVGRYTLLYREGSGDITQALTDKIETLSSIVQGTTQGADYTVGLKKAAKAIHKKQGTGVPR